MPGDGHLVGGVAHQHVDAAQLGDRLPDELLAVRLLPQVAGSGDAPASGLLHDADGLLGVVLLLGQVGDDQVRPLAGEGQRDGPPDPRVTTGDEGPLAL
jgi:hypothetical protein